MNSMAWNLMFRESTAGYLDAINELVDLVKETIQKDLVRVLWISGLATNNRRSDQTASGYLFRAVNQLVLKKIKAIGVETLDVNTMLYSVNEYPVDFVHYLQIHPAKQHRIKGKFGPGVADRIVEQICYWIVSLIWSHNFGRNRTQQKEHFTWAWQKWISKSGQFIFLWRLWPQIKQAQTVDDVFCFPIFSFNSQKVYSWIWIVTVSIRII